MKLNVFLIAPLMGALAVSGCAVNPENAFPEAQTAQQCYAAFEQGKVQNRQAASNARLTSSGNNAAATGIGIAIGKGINESVNNNRYALCLQRVGATQADLAEIEGQVAPRTTPESLQQELSGGNLTVASPICPEGAGVLRGGSGYCIK